MFQFTIISLIISFEVYSGFAYQCPKSIPYSEIPGLSRISLPVSNALYHFRIENEFLIDSRGRTRYVCVEITPETYALRNKSTKYDSDLYVQTGGDYKEHIIAHSLGGSNDSLNIFPLNQNCKSRLLNNNFEQKLEGLLTEHSRITYVAELEYAYNMTDMRPTRINTLYIDENENILKSVRTINSPPYTSCKTVNQEYPTKHKRSFIEIFKHTENSTKSVNCLDGCRRSECWSKVEDRDKKCSSHHFHSVHANSLCVGQWCYCCSYY
ncbi:uncharacterized protein LOC112604240 [Melanaphis sacchari]|uniref:uncharacterized protein LOC112604240 n=1 Tax=Melanaphis sacchari TaxID=742174 RepID=UPI000DC150D9|nr:uncharacterized protein LOC112604240 [Melanaphis sacchari]XP_025208972.1 uncharacterized protein LOC112604240 [Melanaphis sacchari]